MFAKITIFAAFALAFASPAKALDPQRAAVLAKSIYALQTVQSQVAPAKANHSLSNGADHPEMTAGPNCASNPKPYGRPDTNFCEVEVTTSYGWYADPSLIIVVKGYVARTKINSGAITAQDFQLRSVTATVPDPTGLE